MSRGYGKVQRAVLAYFAKYPETRTSILEIAGYSLGKDLISASEYESYRRAVNSLLAAGELKKLRTRMHNGNYHYCTPAKYLELKSGPFGKYD
jgi:hypothetical protein